MKKGKKFSQLFENEPSRWGLRGDPYLWNEMKNVLENGEFTYPDTEDKFIVMLEKTYEQLTGKPIKEIEHSVFVERYAHGGMSSGHVSPQFWTEIGFPLLRERFRETK